MFTIEFFLFLSITIVVLFLFNRFLLPKRITFMGLMIWLIIVGISSYQGFFEVTPPSFPRIIIVFPGILFLVYFLITRVNTTQVSVYELLWFHILRIPVEVGLYLLYVRKLVPIEMTFLHRNLDILMGVSALMLWLWHVLTGKQLPRRFIIVWNCIGILFLMHIVVVAILSTQTPLQQFGFNQPNRAVLLFPYIYLPTFIVPFVAAAHGWSLKKLWIKPND